MLVLLIIIVVIIVGAGVAARLALPSLRQYRGIQNDKRQDQLERELHMGAYAVLDNPSPRTTGPYAAPGLVPPATTPAQSDPRPPWVKKVNRASTYLGTAGASAASTPPKPKVLHIEDIPDVPQPEPPKKSLYQQWVDDQ